MKKQKLRVYLFRHGQTYYNKNGWFTGWKESNLTPKGIKQAKIIAKKLKNKKFQVAIQTSLSRSKDTLKEVLKYHPECRKIVVDDRIIERSYGKLAGLKHKTIIKKYGEEQYEKWHRGCGERPPKGESFADVEKRVGPFLKWLLKFMKEEKINVAISAHGNSIRLMRKVLEKKTRKQAETWSIPYDKVFVYNV